ncbi:hypothetical protein P3T37_005094 [Kitasatospora sp. MAA4]|uniref:hypothetical protein n=1 Tax=Kitasatospora sp. MAA4 TaxID=3035093 RepID=UPI002476F3C2|nr:hypothetical protein [Kitasatospora sp. MAA4]MDH6135677.1 hypothetical protein [Kitasatospora sp. MAA4]
MSLLVHTFVYDADGGYHFLEDPEYGDTLAGFEGTRARLWGSAAIRALDSRFFPRLDGEDLYVERDEIDDFLAECEAIRPHLNHLAGQCGYDAEYVTERFGNIVAAALRAKAEAGGIVVW